MGGKSIAARAANEKARYRIANQSMKTYMEEKAAHERGPITTDKVECKACGFKARYQFVRCPECGEVRKD